MSMSKRAYGIQGFEEYGGHNYWCHAHGFVDREGKEDNSIDSVVDGEKIKLCPTCHYHGWKVRESKKDSE